MTVKCRYDASVAVPQRYFSDIKERRKYTFASMPDLAKTEILYVRIFICLQYMYLEHCETETSNCQPFPANYKRN